MRSTWRRTVQAVEVVAIAVMLLTGMLPTSVSDSDDVPIVGATPALAAHVQDAVDAFAAHGLPAPTVASIVFQPDDPFCERHGGRYTDSTRVVLLCFDAETTILGSDEVLHRVEERLLLHELAHAWTQQYTTAQQRAAFMALHGVHRWNDAADLWHRRGTEIAAETFVWVLWDRDEPPRSLASKDVDLLADGFEVLTGVRALSDRR